MHKQKTTLSLYVKNLEMSLCSFDGHIISLYPTIHDNHRLERTKKLIETLNPDEIIVNTFIGLGPILTKENIKSICKLPSVKCRNVFSGLSTNENKTIKALSNHCGRKRLIAVESAKIMGYSENYPIERKNTGSFYLLDTFNILMRKSSKIKRIISKSSTQFGRAIIKSWLRNPLDERDAITGRRRAISFMLPYIPRIEKLLRLSRISRVEKKINIQKLKRALKSAFNLDDLLGEIIKMRHKEKYIKLYRTIRSIERTRNKNQNSGAESTMEEHQLDRTLETKLNRVSETLDAVAQVLSLQHKVPLCVVFFFPQLGFLLESPIIIEQAIFQIKDKFYCKSKEMKKLDQRFGDPHDQARQKEALLFSKIARRIKGTNFTYFYDYIGEIDALTTCALNGSGEYGDCVENDGPLAIDGAEIPSKCIIQEEFPGIEILEFVVLNQIGVGSRSSYKVPLYNAAAYLPKESTSIDIKNSRFQQEVINAGVVFRDSTPHTLVIIEDPFHSTAPMEGLAIFSAFVESLAAKNLLISSKFEFEDCAELAMQVNGKLLMFANGRIQKPESNPRVNEEIEILSKTCKYFLFRD